jgi:hypothetical protein
MVQAAGKRFDYTYDDSDDDAFDREFEKDQIIDCQDSVKAWLLAVVTEVSDTKVKIAYLDWPDKWVCAALFFTLCFMTRVHTP